MRDTPLHDDQVYDNFQMQQEIVERQLCVISEKELETIFDESFITDRDLGDEDLK